MNIIFALPEGLTLGGVTTFSVELSHRLAGQGQPAVLIEHSTMYGNPKLDFGLAPEIKVINCRHLPHPDNPQLDVANYLPAYRSVLPGVIVPNWAYGTFAACAALATTEAAAMRVIGYAHADEPGYYEWLTYYEAIIHRFVAVSQEIGATLVKLLPYRAADIVVRPYAVESPATLKRSYTAAGEPLRLIYAGRMVQRQKRIFDLVRLVTRMNNEGVDFRLRLVGDGLDKETLRWQLAALDPAVRQRVSLEDSLPPHQMPDAWLSADIFVLVSEYEGTSIAMLEAMAYGCVPVVTEVSGMARVIQPGMNGFLVPVSDIAEMTRVIKTLDDQRQRLAKVGMQAHHAIAAQFGYDEYGRWFHQMVHEVWQQPPRPWSANRPLLRLQAGLSGEEIARQIPVRKLIKALAFKMATRPGFRWLYRFRGLGKRILGN